MSPRTKRQFEEIREEKKALIMESALEHFANEGFHAATINHIAKHAGISKGLMYNYFESKETLLEAILQKSVFEIYRYFDINKDGYLSEDEFEFFIRKISIILSEKRTFWRLFFQLIMQNEVRQTFSALSFDPLIKMEFVSEGKNFVQAISGMLTEYFRRKKSVRGPEYDPLLEMNFFIITLKGYAITRIYIDDEKDDERILNHIINQFK